MKDFPDTLKKKYRLNWSKFLFRILMLAGILVTILKFPGEMKVLEGMNFFRHFSVMHLFWLAWFWYMLEKLLPIKNCGRKALINIEKPAISQYRNLMGYRLIRTINDRQTGEQDGYLQLGCW